MVKKENLKLLVLACILLCAVFLRFYKLGEIPAGLTDDEVNAGYDAYSLLRTGKDQWGQQYPMFSFKGFGDYRSPVYTYLLLPIFSVFDMTPFWLRFPAALLGSVSVFLIYILAKRMKFSSVAALFAAFLLAINPWHVGISRTAMVVVSGVFFIMAGMVLIFYGKKRLLVSILASVCFAISVYAYTAYIVITPLCIVFIGLILYREKQITIRQSVIGIGIFLLMVIPFVISSQTNSLGVRMNQVNIFRDSGTVDLLNEKIGACQKAYPVIACKFVYNRYIVFSTVLVKNFIHHFSSDLLLTNGTNTQFSVLPKRGLLLGIEYVFLCIGAIALLATKKQKLLSLLLLGVVIATAIPDSLTSDGHYGRFFVVIPFIQLISGYGAGFLVGRFGSWLTILLASVLIIETGAFCLEYTSYFPYAYSRYSHYGYKELSLKIFQEKNEYDRIYVSSAVNDSKQYIFYLYYTKYDPMKYQKGENVIKIVEPNGWVRVGKIDNIYFIPSILTFDRKSLPRNAKSLFIGAPNEFIASYVPVQWVVRDVKGDILFEAVRYEDYIRCQEIECQKDL